MPVGEHERESEWRRWRMDMTARLDAAEAEVERLRNVADEALRSLRAGRPAEAEAYLLTIRNRAL